MESNKANKEKLLQLYGCSNESEVIKYIKSDDNDIIMRYKKIKGCDCYFRYIKELKFYIMYLENSKSVVYVLKKDLVRFIKQLNKDGWHIIAFNYNNYFDIFMDYEINIT